MIETIKTQRHFKGQILPIKMSLWLRFFFAMLDLFESAKMKERIMGSLCSYTLGESKWRSIVFYCASYFFFSSLNCFNTKFSRYRRYCPKCTRSLHGRFTLRYLSVSLSVYLFVCLSIEQSVSTEMKPRDSSLSQYFFTPNSL